MPSLPGCTQSIEIRPQKTREEKTEMSDQNKLILISMEDYIEAAMMICICSKDASIGSDFIVSFKPGNIRMQFDVETKVWTLTFGLLPLKQGLCYTHQFLANAGAPEIGFIASDLLSHLTPIPESQKPFENDRDKPALSHR